MEETNIEFDFLAQATFDLTAAAAELRNPFEEFSVNTVQIPNGAGVLYRVDQGISTFCIRAIASENLKETYQEVQDENPKLLKKLKVEAAPLEGLHYFSTESVELAEVIMDQLVNRRFPLEEDLLCNLSDPGFSWWMDDQEDGFDIYFSSHGLGRAERFIQLGPIGDRTIAATRLNSALNLLRHSFPVREVYCDEKMFSIRVVNKEHFNYRIFREIFLKGENPTKKEGFDSFDEGRTLYYFFKESAVLRKFWLEVESKLVDSPNREL